jgi:predicted kinase
MVGLPGAGKTTRAREIERERRALRLTPDEWMDALGVELRDETFRGRIEALHWQLAARVLVLGNDVVLDFGLWSRAARDDIRARAAEFGASTEVHFLDVPGAELLARRAARGAHVAYTVDELDLWIRQFEPPTAEELSPRSL